MRKRIPMQKLVEALYAAGKLYAFDFRWQLVQVMSEILKEDLAIHQISDTLKYVRDPYHYAELKKWGCDFCVSYILGGKPNPHKPIGRYVFTYNEQSEHGSDQQLHIDDGFKGTLKNIGTLAKRQKYAVSFATRHYRHLTPVALRAAQRMIDDLGRVEEDADRLLEDLKASENVA